MLPHTPRSTLPAIVALAAVLAVLAPLTAVGPAAYAAPVAAASAPTAVQTAAPPAERNPSLDHPRLPQRCLEGDEYIPSNAEICRIRWYGARRPTIVMWGDSHSWQHEPAVLEAVRGKRVNLVAFFMGSCPAHLVYRSKKGGHYRTGCEVTNAAALEWVTRQHDRGRDLRVLLGGAWSSYRLLYRAVRRGDTADVTDFQAQMATLYHEGTAKLFRRLGAEGVDTDVIAQGVFVPEDPPACDRVTPYTCDFSRKAGLPGEAATKRWLKRQMRKLPGRPVYVDPNGKVCGRSTCHGVVDGIYTFFDRGHYSATRSRTFVNHFRKSVNRLL